MEGIFLGDCPFESSSIVLGNSVKLWPVDTMLLAELWLELAQNLVEVRSFVAESRDLSFCNCYKR
jgi:hypothetical protein